MLLLHMCRATAVERLNILQFYILISAFIILLHVCICVITLNWNPEYVTSEITSHARAPDCETEIL